MIKVKDDVFFSVSDTGIRIKRKKEEMLFNLVISKQLNCTILSTARKYTCKRGGIMISALDSAWVETSRFEPWTGFVLCSQERHSTLTVTLSTQEYKMNGYRCHSGFGPPGPNPLADMDPPDQIR